MYLKLRTAVLTPFVLSMCKVPAAAPGSSTEVKVGYNAEATGLFDKNITVYYNGGRTQSLYIRGNVWQTPQQSVPENAFLNVFKQFP